MTQIIQAKQHYYHTKKRREKTKQNRKNVLEKEEYFFNSKSITHDHSGSAHTTVQNII